MIIKTAMPTISEQLQIIVTHLCQVKQSLLNDMSDISFQDYRNIKIFDEYFDLLKKIIQLIDDLHKCTRQIDKIINIDVNKCYTNALK